jgi:hypothetical protein
MTVDCPLDCEFLREARRHEKLVPINPDVLPNPEVQLTHKFLEENEHLLIFLGRTIAMAGREPGGIVDFDVRDALDGLIRTYRTLQSGVYYESIPPNPRAAALYRVAQAAIAQYRQEEPKHRGSSKTRDSDVLGLLVFMQRLEMDRNNGRRRGRAFIGALHEYYGAEPELPALEPSTLILP